MANNYPIELVRGASATITLTLKDNDGDAINLTGANVIFAVKNKKDVIEAYDGDDSTALIKVEQTSWLSAAEVKAFNDGFNFAVAAMTEQGSET